MPIDVGLYQDGALETLRRLVADPALADEFEIYQGPRAIESALADPFCARPLCFIASSDGVPAGFCLTFVLPSHDVAWAMARIGVLPGHQQRGIGSALLESLATALPRHAPECREICLAAWQPSDSAGGFAARHGFAHARYFWMMQRPGGAVPAPEWPGGVEARPFDGTDRAFADWCDVYNRSFADHYHSVRSTVDDCRALSRRSSHDAKGLILAYRHGRCVGFCRNERYPSRGEIGSLGVSPEARGAGLGRALLRWGARQLEQTGAVPVTLMVDGQNDGALALYRSEGFESMRTRRMWARPIDV